MRIMSKSTSKYKYIHGVLVVVNGVGILLMGKPGSGKSKLAYDLILEGHSLVADDIVKCFSTTEGLFGALHNDEFLGKIHVRNAGVVDVRNIHNSSTQPKSRINACILINGDTDGCNVKSICGVKIPFYSINAGKAGYIYSIIQRLSIS